MKINILITCHQRENYLGHALRSIHRSPVFHKHEFKIIVIAERTGGFLPEYSYIEMVKPPIYWNKSEWLNKGFKMVDRDADWIIQWDCDLIMNPETLPFILNSANDWIVLGGMKLSEDFTLEIIDQPVTFNDLKNGHIEKDTIEINNRKGYVGNIAMNQKTYRFYRAITESDDLYYPGYDTWGCEDSELSITSSFMAQKGLIKKYYFSNAWRHLWHPPTEKDEQKYNRNLKTMWSRIEKNKKKILDYMN